MAISDRLTKLSEDITSAYKSINDLGGTIPAHKNTENISVAIDSIYNRLPKVSGTGSDITLTPTLKGRLGSVINGDTLQNGTPTPSTPIEIQSVEGIQNVSIVGKNLLPFTNQDFTFKNVRYYVQNGNIYLDGTSTGETSANTTEFKENFNFVLPAGTYYFNRGQSGDTLSLPSYIRKYDDNSDLATNWGLFTLQEETKVFLGFYIYQKTFENNLIDIQLEKGSTSTSYQPYQTPQTVEVDLGNIKLYSGDKITGTPDNWSIYREYKNVKLKDLEWVYASTNNYFYATASDMYQETSGNVMFKGYSSSYTRVPSANNNGWASKPNYSIGTRQTTNYICIKDTDYTTNTALVNARGENEIVYKLATPTTTPITDTYLITQLNALYNAKSCNGQTNISVSGNLPMILEVSALKGEV